ncbi:MAG: exodeoxyribonuclease VII small subunit [Kiritimatiellae bacterium]|nr:exodeoxyribonuclease VII small subunit [Kiritimatiellia bacterium]MBQ3344987.1 exodeoxyribonuclease VII small subunit [Kiritimatiellia bacterium]
MNFEDNLRQLEALVAKMESGEMKLDDMIKSFEEGRRLVKACQEELASIRQRIEKVTESGAVEPLNLDA